tara:strand:+ start:1585 stop:1872 length:288 start_codon:yes stop_codon:yes gene_type:complete
MNTETFKLIKISEFRKKYFDEGSAPSVNSIKKSILLGELTGKKIGTLQYIVLDNKFFQTDSTIDELYEFDSSNQVVEKHDNGLSPLASEIFAKYA